MKIKRKEKNRLLRALERHRFCFYCGKPERLGVPRQLGAIVLCVDCVQRVQVLGKVYKVPTEIPWLTVPQVAKYLDVSLATLWKWTRTKQIPCVRLGKKFIRFQITQLTEWLERSTIPALTKKK